MLGSDFEISYSENCFSEIRDEAVLGEKTFYPILQVSTPLALDLWTPLIGLIIEHRA